LRTVKPSLDLPLWLLLTSCTAAPVELSFRSGGTGDRKDGDRVSDGGVGGASVPVTGPGPPVSDPAPLAFSPGPSCPRFPDVCDDVERPKCTVISDDPGYRSSCVPVAGNLGLGEPCERRVRGDDDCAPGGFCSPLGEGFQSDHRLVCQELCASDDDCPGSERCVALLSDERLGLCREPCPVFDDAACGSEELRCAAAAGTDGARFGYCEIFGQKGDGEPCTLTSQCERGSSCELDSQSCRRSCDDEHACPEELRCLPLELGDPDSLRLCVP
jgi:hypothetical protein